MTAAVTPRQELPRWADILRQKYLAGEASTFVLYRNVFDNVLVGDKLHNLGSFLVEELFKDTKQHVCEVSLERGIRVLSGSLDDKRLALQRELEGEAPDLLASLHALEQRMRTQPSTAVIVPYADALLPAGDPSFMAQPDRQTYLVFHRWSLDQALTQGDNIVVLITESLNAINPGLLSNPKVAAIEIPMPDLPLRKKVIGHFAPQLSEHQKTLFSERTSGLRTVQLANILAAKGQGLSEAERRTLIGQLLEGTPDAQERANTLATITAGMTPAEITRLIEPGKTLPEGDADQEVLKVIYARKREMIEKECAGLIEFIEPKHGLSSVGGHEHIKHELMAIAQNLKSGESTLTPMGLLAVGPMGSGKTFVIKAFLKEAGLSAVALKNFRSKWVGSTEANLERVLATVKAMGPIAVIIDEGDRSFGSGGGEDSDGGTSSRVIARLKEFMAETENRGQVLFVMMTNRPDKLDTDIKRPGRLDRKIPFFYCESAPERVQVLQAVLSRYDESCVATQEQLLTLCEPLTGYSNADLEAVALLAVEFARQNKAPLDAEDLTQAVTDFMPPQERDMIEFMELLAVSETSRRSMLPKRYRDMAIADIQSNLLAAKRRALTR
ncbi:ATP-binding protein [Hydrogenophaga sp. RWCD_12]|uniref:ATP-binding protein n=1 Tax=Hydrogenophaga sp. RWCD_12 TaxID=3391190 RepID=UPI00398514A1